MPESSEIEAMIRRTGNRYRIPGGGALLVGSGSETMISRVWTEVPAR